MFGVVRVAVGVVWTIGMVAYEIEGERGGRERERRRERECVCVREREGGGRGGRAQGRMPPPPPPKKKKDAKRVTSTKQVNKRKVQSEDNVDR